jgi:hypothetical protein
MLLLVERSRPNPSNWFVIPSPDVLSKRAEGWDCPGVCEIAMKAASP